MKRDRYICIKNCTAGNAFIHHYFYEGNIYTVRMMERSKWCYIEYSAGQDSGVDESFIKENFKLATDDTLLMAELNVLFDVFFEQ